MSKIDYYRAILLGVVVGMGFLTLFYIMFTPFTPEEVKETKNNFTVIDTYKGCDVVQWNYNMLADYKYFLYCNNTRPVYEK
jgi:hypothetical protein